MATCNININVEKESFLSHIVRVRSEIQTKFLIAHKILQDREADLLAELQILVDKYTGDGVIQQIKQLSVCEDILRDTLTENENREFLDQSLASINARIKVLRNKLQRDKDTYNSISLEWDVQLEKSMSVAGGVQLNAKKKGIRDYKVGEPVVVFGKHNNQKSSLPGVFCRPSGITINPLTNYIYICDPGNNRIQVFNEFFEFVFIFNEKMGSPLGICLNIFLYVTQFHSNCLNVYSTEGKYLTSVGQKGVRVLEFDHPLGVVVSTEKDRIYIADHKNDRVQCLNLHLLFTSVIEGIQGPLDIKLTHDEVLVLSNRNPCVTLYTYSHEPIRHIIPRGEGSPISLPYSFFLDEANNIFISDKEGHVVRVFSYEGILKYTVGRGRDRKEDFIKPRGITIDAQGRILVLTENSENCVQLFQNLT